MQRPPASAPLVAIIDEDVWLLRQLSEDLQRLGVRVLGWNSPTFAAPILTRERCDAIVTEGPMKARSGLDLCTEVIEKLEGERPVMVLLTESSRAFTKKERALFDVCLRKPIDAEALLEEIKKAREARGIAEDVTAAEPAAEHATPRAAAGGG